MTYAITTLGCKVNTYESNVMDDILKNAGYKEVAFSDIADIYIINTCTVTNNADHKSVKLIKQAINKNPDAIVVAVGCYVQTNSSIVTEIEGLDIIIGNKNKSNIVNYIEKYLETKSQILDIEDICDTDFERMELNNFDKTRAFVKIQDGCNNYCSFCIIPYARGNVRSKDFDLVVQEVNTLVSNGHKEIVLTGIHTGAYGVDINTSLEELLKELVKIEDLNRIRISSIEITEITDQILDIFKEHPVFVDHMHIPLQSGSDTILKAMNRKYDVNYFINRIEEIRKIRPDMLFTTDVIVGFPGETEELFLETINTIETIGFHKLHVFPYSKRTGTVAAEMDDHVKDIVKKDRVKKLLKLSIALEIKNSNKFVGKKIKFLSETYKDGYLMGHAGNYLSIKTIGNENELNKEIEVEIEKIMYPFCIGKRL